MCGLPSFLLFLLQVFVWLCLDYGPLLRPTSWSHVRLLSFIFLAHKKERGKKIFFSRTQTYTHTHTHTNQREVPYPPSFYSLFLSFISSFFIFGYAFLFCSYNFTIFLAYASKMVKLFVVLLRNFRVWTSLSPDHQLAQSELVEVILNWACWRTRTGNSEKGKRDEVRRRNREIH